jgi:hypothetical protein
VRRAWNWFFLALCLLAALQITSVVRDPWFTLPPKPVGDGPDYENLAYHLSQGEGWSYDWTDPAWRAPYLAAQLKHPVLPKSSTAGTSAPENYAVQLARRDGLAPTTARPPLLPTLIALVYCVVERGPVALAAVRIILACCLAVAGASAVAMSARIASLLTARAWPVVLASTATLALAGLDRTARSYATDFLTEPLALLLLQLWLWCVCELLSVFDLAASVNTRLDRALKIRALATLSGILLGLLIYARSAIVLWLPGIWLLLVVGWWMRAAARRAAPTSAPTSALLAQSADRRRGLAVATRVVLVALLVCVPWWLRNCVVLGEAMPLGTQGAITLVGGYSDEALAAHGEWQLEPELRLRQRVENELEPGAGSSLVRREVRVAQAASREVRNWAIAHLGNLPRLAWYRLVTEWNPYTGRALLWKLAALLGLVVLALRLPAVAAVFGGIILINTLMVMLLYSVGGRFLVPTYGMLYTLAVIGAMSLPLAVAGLVFRRTPGSSSQQELH